jgi:hypothetical protein
MADKTNERQPSPVKMRVRRLTHEDIGKIRERAAARMTALEQRWEKSGHTDFHALLGALIFCKLRLPPWLFTGLMQLLQRQLPQEPPPYHRHRWFMVLQGHDLGGLSWEESYAYASNALANTPARGSPGTMKRRPRTYRRKKAN